MLKLEVKMEKFKLVKIIRLSGKIVLKTGLHIGAGSDEIHIGGIDNPVVKDPVTGWPYIPGSSLKGKIRSLLEWSTGRVKKEGEPWWNSDEDDPIVRIFGNGKNIKDYKGGPTRVSFVDCFMDKDQAKDFIGKGILTESKTEVSINRITSKANPRTMERVPAGAEFEFELTYRVFDMGDNGSADEENFKLLLAGLRLLEYDALGGSGSRGYGRIEFEGLSAYGYDSFKELPKGEELEKILNSKG